MIGNGAAVPPDWLAAARLIGPITAADQVSAPGQVTPHRLPRTASPPGNTSTHPGPGLPRQVCPSGGLVNFASKLYLHTVFQASGGSVWDWAGWAGQDYNQFVV